MRTQKKLHRIQSDLRTYFENFGIFVGHPFPRRFHSLNSVMVETTGREDIDKR